MKQLIKVIFILFALTIPLKRLAAQSTDGSVSLEIKKQLDNKIPGLYYPKTVKRFYIQNNFKPAWIKPQRGEGHAWQAMLMLDCVLQYGLSHADYHPKKLSYTLLHDILDNPGKVDIKTQVWFDVMLTDAIINFMNNLHYGKLNPYFTNNKLDEGNINGFYADAILTKALLQKDILNTIAAVQPMSAEYLEMLRHMALLKGRYDGDCYDVPESTIRKLAINMERMRWASIDQSTYIHINIPSYTLMFHQPDTTYLFKVIVGKPATPTPTLLSAISYFTTTPEWRVPASILAKELLPKAIAETSYLTNNNFIIQDKNGVRVDINNANLQKVKAAPTGYVAIQMPGKNALGDIIFRFANAHGIFLHDTPDQVLFKKKERAFSHGCIRVEQAQKLATLILKNDGNADKIFKTQKNTSRRKNLDFNLTNLLPIKITYLTCAVKEGEFITYKDIYKLDKKLEIAMYGLK